MDHVLIIEDDPDIIALLELHLRDQGYEVTLTQTGPDGLKAALHQHFQLIILDLTLPGGVNGIEICRQLRATGSKTPILMLTARSEEIDKVLGLEMGADDYMTKPFSIREFIARVHAILRRTRERASFTPGEKIMRFADLEIDRDKRRTLLRSKRIELSPKEFELLVLLASHPGRSYSRQQLLDLVWGYDFAGMEHTVNSHINRLRSKIESDMSQPQYILTTWGVGYRFNEDL
ncbi:MAG: response regulator transcription factor [Bacteroidia bacterium]|nr:response regulator transcription factor [Bacteroidia bacterium]